jgi:hypothetical protein
MKSQLHADRFLFRLGNDWVRFTSGTNISSYGGSTWKLRMVAALYSYASETTHNFGCSFQVLFLDILQC